MVSTTSTTQSAPAGHPVSRLRSFDAGVDSGGIGPSSFKTQAQFVPRPDGIVETFADAWGLLALRLFFERFTVTQPTTDAGVLVQAAYVADLHKLIGVPRAWLTQRIEGAADMFLSEELYPFESFEESDEERTSARRGEVLQPPPPGSEAQRRQTTINQVIRRGDNRRFLHLLYEGRCQVSGITLRIPTADGFTVDCAHIRPLGMPHRGPDDVSNMLSLCPTMHRLFDRRCKHRR